MHTHFVIHQGYVEDQSLTCLTLSHATGFRTPEEAMEVWYGFLLTLAQDRVAALQECCQKTRELPSSWHFYCIKCGKRLDQDGGAEAYVTKIWEEIWMGTNDSTGIELWQAMQEAGWGFDWPTGPFVTIFRIERILERFDGEAEGEMVWVESRD